jgi:hypothetical protein
LTAICFGPVIFTLNPKEKRLFPFQVSRIPEVPPPHIRPSHKITVGEADDVITYWYVQTVTTALAFDPKRHRDLVELIHAKGQQFRSDAFESFAIGTDRNYHLERIGPREFIIKSLR